MAQVTWKKLVVERMLEATGRSARARRLIADVLQALGSPEVVAADAASLPDRAQRAEGVLAQASCLLGEAASVMAVAWHIWDHAVEAILVAPPLAATDDDDDYDELDLELERMRSGLNHLQGARARAEKACLFAEDSRGEVRGIRLLLRHPRIHLLDTPLDLRRAAAIRALEFARNFEAESVLLARKAARCLR